MKDRIISLYGDKKLNADGVLKAVSKKFITIDDALEIVGKENALSIIKTAKLNEISKSCNETIVAGVDLELGEETVHFNLSIEDQSNINNLFRVVELGCTEYPYQSDGGVCRIYTAAEIAQIYLTAQSLITTQTTYHNTLKSYVQSLEDVESISSVVYGMELPEPYNTEMQAKLLVAQEQVQAIVSRLGSMINNETESESNTESAT